MLQNDHGDRTQEQPEIILYREQAHFNHIRGHAMKLKSFIVTVIKRSLSSHHMSMYSINGFGHLTNNGGIQQETFNRIQLQSSNRKQHNNARKFKRKDDLKHYSVNIHGLESVIKRCRMTTIIKKKCILFFFRKITKVNPGPDLNILDLTNITQPEILKSLAEQQYI